MTEKRKHTEVESNNDSTLKNEEDNLKKQNETARNLPSHETYLKAGVDIDSGNKVVEIIKDILKKSSTQTNFSAQIGGFSAFFDLSDLGMMDPCLFFSTDGVGTKLKIAFMLNKHDTVGIDLVAMCANDVLVSGAKPYIFQDYIACNHLDEKQIVQIIEGIVKGCEEATCNLTGGETAEMPDFYNSGEYDLAGFCMGAVPKARIIDGKKAVQNEDVLIGLASSGLHSNGYSLVRKVFFKDKNYSLDHKMDNTTLGDILLTPTKIYVKPILEILKDKTNFNIKAMVNITGGGFIDNIPRVLPAELSTEIKIGTWPVPKIFKFLRENSNIELREMFRTFNMGIGFVLIVPTKQADNLVKKLNEIGENAYIIGKVKRDATMERVALIGQEKDHVYQKYY